MTPIRVAASGGVTRAPDRSATRAAPTLARMLQPGVSSIGSNAGGVSMLAGYSPMASRQDAPSDTVTVTMSPGDAGSIGTARYSDRTVAPSHGATAWV